MSTDSFTNLHRLRVPSHLYLELYRGSLKASQRMNPEEEKEWGLVILSNIYFYLGSVKEKADEQISSAIEERKILDDSVTKKRTDLIRAMSDIENLVEKRYNSSIPNMISLSRMATGEFIRARTPPRKPYENEVVYRRRLVETSWQLAARSPELLDVELLDI